MYRSENIMKILRYFLFALWQCSWGLLQSFAGLIFFVISLKYEHSFYHGCILTKRSGIGGVSLGLFIFVSDKENPEQSSRTAVHEYGHAVQSLLLGPLYLPVIGLVSSMWCALPVFEKLRQKKHISYNACYTEAWANHLGERVLHQASTR